MVVDDAVPKYSIQGVSLVGEFDIDVLNCFIICI